MDVDLEQAQEQLGEAIRAKRLELGYSQEALAHECGVHRTYMGSIERGERNLSLLNILRIAKSLGVKASELLKDSRL